MRLFQEIRKLRDEYKAKVASVGKEAVIEAYKEYFADNPTVQAVRWSQYTPHFNDGDACTFGVNEANIKFAGGDPSAGDDDDGFEYVSSYKATPERKKATETPDIPDDVCEAVFGDGVRVTLTRDGGCEVEEYDHD